MYWQPMCHRHWLVVYQCRFFPKTALNASGPGRVGVVTMRWHQYMYGSIPRILLAPNLAGVVDFCPDACFVGIKPPIEKQMFYFSAIYPIIAFWLLLGGLGLEPVDSEKIGGIVLTVTLGVMGISLSLPIGILLALGRRSDMPIVRMLCVIFIEFIRGVPMISLLFMATVLAPIPTPACRPVAVVFIVVMFASAYIAEVVRGGQAIPRSIRSLLWFRTKLLENNFSGFTTGVVLHSWYCQYLYRTIQRHHTSYHRRYVWFIGWGVRRWPTKNG